MKKTTFIITLLLLVTLSGCNKEYTITFDKGMGHIDKTVETVNGLLEEVPSDPGIPNYDFNGWYTDTSYQTPADLTQMFTEDTTFFPYHTASIRTISVYDKNNLLIETFEATIEDDLHQIAIDKGYDKFYLSNSLQVELPYDYSLIRDASFIVDQEKTLQIGVLAYVEQDLFLNELINDYLLPYEELYNIEFIVKYGQYDAAVQWSQFVELIEMDVDGILLNLVNPDTAQDMIDEANNLNIPIVFYMQNPSFDDSTNDIYSVNTNFLEQGTAQADLAISHFIDGDIDADNDGVFDYAFLHGDLYHPAQISRTNGFENELSVQGVTTLKHMDASSQMWSLAEAKLIVEAWITNGDIDKIDAIICNNDGMAIGASSALQEAGITDVAVYGIDAIDETLEQIETGYITGTVGYDKEAIARNTVNLIVAMIKGDSIDSSIIDYPAVSMEDYYAIHIPSIQYEKETEQ